jgi:two-component system sensor histidine kinase KdpD
MCNYLIKMNSFISLNSIQKKDQYILSVLIIMLLSTINFIFLNYIAYAIPFILLFASLYIYIFLDILPAVVAIILAGITWDLLFLKPHFLFDLHKIENVVTILVFGIIALINVYIITKIKNIQRYVFVEKKLEQTVKFYDTLLNSLSHELRTPISVIVGATDSLLQQDLKISDSNKNDLLQEISTASLRLNQQVENLLNTSRLQSGFLQLKKDWCDITELIYGIISQLTDQLKGHVINVSIKKDSLVVKIDHGLIEQVLFNLINNAAQHTPPHSVISIVADYIDEKLVLIIEDNGKGFPTEDINQVFNKFYRSKNSVTGGLGLGLSIAKGFVEVHDGSIELQRSIPTGAKFIIKIPAENISLKITENE